MTFLKLLKNSNTIKIIELEEIPLSYLPSGSVRIHAKAVGDIF